jgi:hypothetical protein
VAPISGPDAAKADADSAAARTLRANAASLAAAGIPVALSGRGLGGPAQLRERLLAAVEAGLSPDDALRALTVTPARLLGLEAALGTVEPGKLANLVVVQGDLFTKDAKIRHVFVEGLRFDIPAAAVPRSAGGRGGRGAGGAGAGAAGEWGGEMEGPNGMMNFTLTIRAEGAALAGQLITEMGTVDLRGEQTGDDISLRGTAAPPGMNAMEIAISGRVSDNQIQGTLDVAGMASVPFTARRRGPGSAWEQGGSLGNEVRGGRS